MPIAQDQLFCLCCKKPTLHQANTPNHLVHALVTLFLCGLWIPVWIMATINKDKMRCQSCGTEFGKESIADSTPKRSPWIAIVLFLFLAPLVFGLFKLLTESWEQAPK